MKMSEITRTKRTAISRKIASLPMRLIINEDLSGHGLHFGCGKDQAGTALLYDIPEVRTVMEYDPNYADYPGMLNHKYNFVIANYVLNVLPPKIRKTAIQQIYRCLKPNGVGYITVRAKGQPLPNGTSLYDGYRTSIGTFQKFYTIAGLKRELNKYFTNVQIMHGKTSSKFIMVKVKR